MILEAYESFDVGAPEGWRVQLGPAVHWYCEFGYELPPGELLSGFVIRNAVLQDRYEYGLAVGPYKYGDYFTPVPIPEPVAVPLVGCGAGAMGLWILRRRARRQT